MHARGMPTETHIRTQTHMHRDALSVTHMRMQTHVRSHTHTPHAPTRRNTHTHTQLQKPGRVQPTMTGETTGQTTALHSTRTTATTRHSARLSTTHLNRAARAADESSHISKATESRRLPTMTDTRTPSQATDLLWKPKDEKATTSSSHIMSKTHTHMCSYAVRPHPHIVRFGTSQSLCIRL